MNQQTLTKQEQKNEKDVPIKPKIEIKKMTGLEYNPDGMIVTELPGGIIADGQIYRNVVLDTLDGETEELIADPKYQNNFEKLLTKILTKLVFELGPFKKEQITEEIIRHLLIADRDFLFFKIIQDNNGEILDEVKFVCPHCGHAETFQNFDTKLLDVHWLMNDIDYVEGEFESKCIFQGKPVKSFFIRFPRGIDNESVPNTDNLGIRRTFLLKACLMSIDDIKPEKGFNPVDIKKLKLRHRNKMYNVMSEKNPGVDYMYDRVCSSCNKEYSGRVNLGSFF